MPIALIYHDVVPAGQFDVSGFSGPGAAHYKFSKGEFRSHLEALQRAVGQNGQAGFAAESDSCRQPANRQSSPLPCLLTFDDGGNSSILTIAGMLEERGWTGNFFVSTDFIDTPAFVSRQQISELRERGHVVGSHSCSHPVRMSGCCWEQLVDEWRRSCQILSAVIDEPITVASVPGGFYSRRVAQAAALAGIRTLFTSEPTRRSHVVDGCEVLGRYSIDRSVSIRQMTDIATGKLLPRLKQALMWQAKKIAKTIAGPLYAAVRERLLRSRIPAGSAGKSNRTANGAPR